MLRPRRAPMRALTEAICGSRTAPETASTAAQRSSREPCLSVVQRTVKGVAMVHGARQSVPDAVSGDGQGGQGRAAGPPGGAALTARTAAVSTMSEEARQGCLSACCYAVADVLSSMWVGRMRAVPA